jgi:hypothetical protein
MPRIFNSPVQQGLLFQQVGCVFQGENGGFAWF